MEGEVVIEGKKGKDGKRRSEKKVRKMKIEVEEGIQREMIMIR